MAKVSIVDCSVKGNPSPFLSDFTFEITFDSFENLTDDLEWKMVYVGSAENCEHDQTLDSVLVGPVTVGRHKFAFSVPAPDPAKIPVEDAVGVTVILLSCSYKNQEFVQIGYFVNNEYEEEELRENPPAVPDFSKVTRSILATEPRVTKFNINWSDDPAPIASTSSNAKGETGVSGPSPNPNSLPASLSSNPDNTPTAAGVAAH